MRVKIKDNSNIKFHNKCVICGEKCLDEKFEITGINDNGYLFFRYLLNYFSPAPKINVPIHKTCYDKVNSNDSILQKAGAVSFFSAFGISYWLRNEFDYWNWIISLIVTILIYNLLSWFIRDTPFCFSKNEYRYEFVFGNKQIAEEFKELNKDNLFDIGTLINPKK